MGNKIRRDYRQDIPIIIRMGSGFFDKKIFECCEKLKIGYVCGGKIYEDIKTMVSQIDDSRWHRFDTHKKDTWEYIEYGCRRGNWKRFRRAVYCRLLNEGNQLHLPGCRPDTTMITNIGQGQAIDEMLKAAGAAHYLETEAIVACHHDRGNDELANRALKDFGHEQLPFKRFNPNAAWYYTMLLGHFLMESFKEDVGMPVVAVGAYATTVRRRLIDLAGKIVSHSEKIILKVSTACFDALELGRLFEHCKAVIPIG
jgi:hypothetical protein